MTLQADHSLTTAAVDAMRQVLQLRTTYSAKCEAALMRGWLSRWAGGRRCEGSAACCGCHWRCSNEERRVLRASGYRGEERRAKGGERSRSSEGRSDDSNFDKLLDSAGSAKRDGRRRRMHICYTGTRNNSRGRRAHKRRKRRNKPQHPLFHSTASHSHHLPPLQ